MIALLLILMWGMAGLTTYRRVGYELEADARVRHHRRNTCVSACRCRRCGYDIEYHGVSKVINGATVYSRSGCEGYLPPLWPHSRTVVAAPLTVLFWPGVITFWLMSAVRKQLGLESGPFFKPAPAIESRQERAERKQKEAESREIEQQKRIKELEDALRKDGVALPPSV